MQKLHPLRMQFELFSNANPVMSPVAGIAEQARNNRRPIGADNPFIAMQENMSEQIVRGLDAWRDASEALAERMFLAVYGSPTLQAAVGINPVGTRPLRKPAKSLLHRELLQTRIAEIKSCIPVGGLREAVIRGLLYAGMSRGAIDERGFEAVRRIRQTHSDLSLSAFKALVREQFNILLIDPEAALAAIPSMLPPDGETRRKAFELTKQVMGAQGRLSAEDKERMLRVARLFDIDKESIAVRSLTVVPPARNDSQVKAS
jgi:hypothetical protein